MKIICTGFSHSKGLSKTSQKPYNMARLFHLTSIKSWKNDFGECVCNGYITDDRNAFDVNVQDDELIRKLLLVNFNDQSLLDLEFAPNPENPTRNIIIGFSEVN